MPAPALARPAPRAVDGRTGRPVAAFLRSVMPALDRAFGLEHEAAFPEAIAALVARLHAGPLGQPARPLAHRPDWAAGVTAEAA